MPITSIDEAVQVLEVGDAVINIDIVIYRYKKLSIKLHPDRNPGDNVATENFQKLSEANQLLKNIFSLNEKSKDNEIKLAIDVIANSSTERRNQILEGYNQATLTNIANYLSTNDQQNNQAYAVIIEHLKNKNIPLKEQVVINPFNNSRDMYNANFMELDTAHRNFFIESYVRFLNLNPTGPDTYEDGRLAVLYMQAAKPHFDSHVFNNLLVPKLTGSMPDDLLKAKTNEIDDATKPKVIEICSKQYKDIVNIRTPDIINPTDQRKKFILGLLTLDENERKTVLRQQDADSLHQIRNSLTFNAINRKGLYGLFPAYNALLSEVITEYNVKYSIVETKQKEEIAATNPKETIAETNPIEAITEKNQEATRAEPVNIQPEAKDADADDDEELNSPNEISTPTSTHEIFNQYYQAVQNANPPSPPLTVASESLYQLLQRIQDPFASDVRNQAGNNDEFKRIWDTAIEHIKRVRDLNITLPLPSDANARNNVLMPIITHFQDAGMSMKIIIENEMKNQREGANPSDSDIKIAAAQAAAAFVSNLSETVGLTGQTSPAHVNAFYSDISKIYFQLDPIRAYQQQFNQRIGTLDIPNIETLSTYMKMGGNGLMRNALVANPEKINRIEDAIDPKSSIKRLEKEIRDLAKQGNTDAMNTKTNELVVAKLVYERAKKENKAKAKDPNIKKLKTLINDARNILKSQAQAAQRKDIKTPSAKIATPKNMLSSPRFVKLSDFDRVSFAEIPSSARDDRKDFVLGLLNLPKSKREAVLRSQHERSPRFHANGFLPMMLRMLQGAQPDRKSLFSQHANYKDLLNSVRKLDMIDKNRLNAEAKKNLTIAPLTQMSLNDHIRLLRNDAIYTTLTVGRSFISNSQKNEIKHIGAALKRSLVGPNRSFKEAGISRNDIRTLQDKAAMARELPGILAAMRKVDPTIRIDIYVALSKQGSVDDLKKNLRAIFNRFNEAHKSDQKQIDLINAVKVFSGSRLALGKTPYSSLPHPFAEITFSNKQAENLNVGWQKKGDLLINETLNTKSALLGNLNLKKMLSEAFNKQITKMNSVQPEVKSNYFAVYNDATIRLAATCKLVNLTATLIGKCNKQLPNSLEANESRLKTIIEKSLDTKRSVTAGALRRLLGDIHSELYSKAHPTDAMAAPAKNELKEMKKAISEILKVMAHLDTKFKQDPEYMQTSAITPNKAEVNRARTSNSVENRNQSSAARSHIHYNPATHNTAKTPDVIAAQAYIKADPARFGVDEKATDIQVKYDTDSRKFNINYKVGNESKSKVITNDEMSLLASRDGRDKDKEQSVDIPNSTIRP